MLITACFPWRLPPEIVEQFPLGAFNVHPSWLPRHRGPEPLFWTFRAGDHLTGVTIHRMTGDFDAGPIVAQKSLSIPLRARHDDLDRMTADLAAEMLPSTLDAIVAGSARDEAQDERRATRAPVPAAADLALDDSWPADRAFRFIYGVAGAFGPLTLHLTNGASIRISDVIDMSVNDDDRPDGRADDTITVRLSDGLLRLRVAAG
jgi:methionyl-tRNA formyltransferase